MNEQTRQTIIRSTAGGPHHGSGAGAYHVAKWPFFNLKMNPFFHKKLIINEITFPKPGELRQNTRELQQFTGEMLQMPKEKQRNPKEQPQNTGETEQMPGEKQQNSGEKPQNEGTLYQFNN